jgi:predicted glycosyltransferase
MRLIVYSHDAFGLGNIRRMLAICQHLLDTIPQMSILLISGSPILHSFRLPARLDYIKLPCLGRNELGVISSKYLETPFQEITQLRSDLIKAAVINFKPDLIIVDKKPYGLQGELKETLTYLKKHLPLTKLVLLLRDILDSPETTIQDWQQQGYYQAAAWYYDQILVVGMPEIFNLVQEYQFSANLVEKVKFCGYIRREAGERSQEFIRQQLKLDCSEKLVLVTPGGGGDGDRLIETYLLGLMQQPQQISFKSLVICGPEMHREKRQAIEQLASQIPSAIIAEFTDDLASYINAADLSICMGGYNTICEFLSLNKRAIIIPRTQPVKEQEIRAERMSKLGLFKTIHPNDLTPNTLLETVLEELKSDRNEVVTSFQIDLDALPRISYHILDLLSKNQIFQLDCYSLIDHSISLKAREVKVA